MSEVDLRRLLVEKERLAIEEKRYAIELERLPAEQERSAIETKRLAIEEKRDKRESKSFWISLIAVAISLYAAYRTVLVEARILPPQETRYSQLNDNDRQNGNNQGSNTEAKAESNGSQ